jgi:hypothetical protein
MAESVLALQAAEMIGRGPFRQAIGVAGGDVQSIQHPQTILQIGYGGNQPDGDPGRQVAEGAAESMAPALLAMAQVQCL